MSYSILYRSMFVKLSDGRFIPMMEMGDNNIYDASYRGKARRSRSWSNINLNRGQKFFTEDELRKSLDMWFNESEQKRDRDRNSDLDWARENAEKASFGYYEAIAVYGKGTTGTEFKDVKNIVLGGVKNCISVEDAIKKCGLKITYWKKEEGDTALTCQKYERFNTEEEMFNIINEKFSGDDTKFYFIYNENSDTNWCYNLRKALKSFESISKGRNYNCVCTDKLGTKFYAVVKNGLIVLIDNKEDATVFSKQKSNGLYLSDIVFKMFDDIVSVKYEYL